MVVPHALVVWWSSEQFAVQCPYCPDIHRHGIGQPPRKGRQRQAHCHTAHGDSSYIAKYPDDQEIVLAGSYGWELDRDEQKIYTVTSNGRVFDPFIYRPRRLLVEYMTAQEHERDGIAVAGSARKSDAEAGLLTDGLQHVSISDKPNALKNEPLDNEAWSQAELSDPDFRRSVYVSACCTKDIPTIIQLLKQYPNDNLPQARSREGSNGVMLVAPEPDAIRLLEVLYEKGVSLTEPDHYGRTALMEACLWAQSETVSWLLNKGVAIDTKDANGETALDLAMNTRQNVEERIERANGIVKVAVDADRKRDFIASLLRARLTPVEDSHPPPSLTPIIPGVFKKTAYNTLQYYVADSAFTIGSSKNDQVKAFARLDRGLNHPIVSAMSGYSHGYRQDVLNNEIWTRKVMLLCKKMKFQTSESFLSHVEKQLVAYYMDKHWYKDVWDTDKNKEWKTLTPASLPPAVITVNKNYACDDCEAFLRRLRVVYGDVPVRVVCVGQ